MTPTKRRGKGTSAAERAQWAATYDGTPYETLPWFEPGPSRSVARAVELGFLTPGSRVLDVGCGAGSNVLFLARQGFVASGVDIAPSAVAAAEKRCAQEGLRARLQVGDVLALDFPDRSFEAVVDRGCFHTLPPHQRTRYAREISRVLTPEGRLVLSWVAREYTPPMGPRHRLSLGDVTHALEATFLFSQTQYHPSSAPGEISMYDGWLVQRTEAQPRAR